MASSRKRATVIGGGDFAPLLNDFDQVEEATDREVTQFLKENSGLPAESPMADDDFDADLEFLLSQSTAMNIRSI